MLFAIELQNKPTLLFYLYVNKNDLKKNYQNNFGIATSIPKEITIGISKSLKKFPRQFPKQLSTKFQTKKNAIGIFKEIVKAYFL